jgi:hypothetical protein
MGRRDVPRLRRRGWRSVCTGIVVVVVSVSLLVIAVDVFGAGAAALGRRGGPQPAAVAPAPVDVDAAPIRVEPGARVELWGDSLAWESAAPFVARLREVPGVSLDITTHTFGGTATCDWLSDIRARARHGHIAVAMLEFSGNALTPCMTGTDGQPRRGAAYLDAYRHATLDAISVLQRAGARVYLVGTPPGRRAGTDGDALRNVYEQLAVQRTGVAFVDAGQSVLDHGRWTETLPCLRTEPAADGCVDGRIVVRAPDGAHFCPNAGPAVRGVVGPCPRWSSGAVRFGRAMADAIADVVVPASTPARAAQSR